MAFTLNYDDAIHLDAEALAEGGIVRGMNYCRRNSAGSSRTPPQSKRIATTTLQAIRLDAAKASLKSTHLNSMR